MRPLRSSHQPAKSGSSGDMKSAKAARLSSDVAGSSTTPINRVQGSSSTTTTGGSEAIARSSQSASFCIDKLHNEGRSRHCKVKPDGLHQRAYARLVAGMPNCQE